MTKTDTPYIVRFEPICPDAGRCLIFGPFKSKEDAEAWEWEHDQIYQRRSFVFPSGQAETGPDGIVQVTQVSLVVNITIEPIREGYREGFDIYMPEVGIATSLAKAIDLWTLFKEKYPGINLEPLTSQ